MDCQLHVRWIAWRSGFCCHPGRTSPDSYATTTSWAGVQLGADTADVDARRCRAHEEAVADFSVGEPLGDQGHHLPLPVGEFGEGRVRWRPRARRELRDQPAAAAPGSFPVDASASSGCTRLLSVGGLHRRTARFRRGRRRPGRFRWTPVLPADVLGCSVSAGCTGELPGAVVVGGASSEAAFPSACCRGVVHRGLPCRRPGLALRSSGGCARSLSGFVSRTT